MARLTSLSSSLHWEVKPMVGMCFSTVPTPTIPYQTFPEEETPGSPIHQSEIWIEIEVTGLLFASPINMCCWEGAGILPSLSS